MSPQQEVLRVRGLVIEDADGKDRIVMGAPLPEIGRIRPAVGMAINDENGFERWGVTLQSNGSMGMGFDAPPGTGDDRNRERINIIADERGSSQIRFLDRDTWVKARLYLADDNRILLEFLDFPPGEVVSKRISIGDDEVLRRER